MGELGFTNFYLVVERTKAYDELMYYTGEIFFDRLEECFMSDDDELLDLFDSVFEDKTRSLLQILKSAQELELNRMFQQHKRKMDVWRSNVSLDESIEFFSELYDDDSDIFRIDLSNQPIEKLNKIANYLTTYFDCLFNYDPENNDLLLEELYERWINEYIGERNSVFSSVTSINGYIESCSNYCETMLNNPPWNLGFIKEDKADFFRFLDKVIINDDIYIIHVANDPVGLF